ncbi:exosome complex component MTR3 isoform X1 [Mobula hypostoma]|uniref:exosome complex component MTR3 isoform X1 n=1 Tax=Mobula hypostoma TaxID=723540 RepID=UPI002FC3D2C0
MEVALVDSIASSNAALPTALGRLLDSGPHAGGHQAGARPGGITVPAAVCAGGCGVEAVSAGTTGGWASGGGAEAGVCAGRAGEPSRRLGVCRVRPQQGAVRRVRAPQRFAPFSCKERASWIQSNLEKEYSLILEQSLQPAICLHKYPRSQIEVYVVVLENDGSTLAAALTCASMALAEAGIEMYDVVVGCSLRQCGAISLLDPTVAEEFNAASCRGLDNGSMTVALLPTLNQISGLVSKGEWEGQTSVEAIKCCVEGCQKLYSVVQQCLTKSVKRKIPQFVNKA